MITTSEQIEKQWINFIDGYISRMCDCKTLQALPNIVHDNRSVLQWMITRMLQTNNTVAMKVLLDHYKIYDLEALNLRQKMALLLLSKNDEEYG